MADPRVQAAAVVARTFRIDPVPLLMDGGDDWPMIVRIAAARYVAAKEREAAEKK
jgi:hypothetical protein